MIEVSVSDEGSGLPFGAGGESSTRFIADVRKGAEGGSAWDLQSAGVVNPRRTHLGRGS